MKQLSTNQLIFISDSLNDDASHRSVPTSKFELSRKQYHKTVNQAKGYLIHTAGGGMKAKRLRIELIHESCFISQRGRPTWVSSRNFKKTWIQIQFCI